MKTYPSLYRKRIIPDECILLENDRILLWDEQLIITSWHALKPKPDLDHGYSCYYLNEGYKVSVFCKKDGSILYYYCDIVSFDMSVSQDKMVVTDLLVDVVIKTDGRIEVIDLDELVIASDAGSLSLIQLKSALTNLDQLLKILYKGNLKQLISPILKFEQINESL